MASSPAAISSMPPIWGPVSRSPKNTPPSRIALTGIRKVTSRRFVAPAVARMRK